MRHEGTFSQKRFRLLIVVVGVLSLLATLAGLAPESAGLLTPFEQEPIYFARRVTRSEQTPLPILDPDQDDLRDQFEELLQKLAQRRNVCSNEILSLDRLAYSPGALSSISQVDCYKPSNGFSLSNPSNYQLLPLLT